MMQVAFSQHVEDIPKSRDETSGFKLGSNTPSITVVLRFSFTADRYDYPSTLQPTPIAHRIAQKTLGIQKQKQKNHPAGVPRPANMKPPCLATVCHPETNSAPYRPRIHGEPYTHKALDPCASLPSHIVISSIFFPPEFPSDYQ